MVIRLSKGNENRCPGICGLFGERPNSNSTSHSGQGIPSSYLSSHSVSSCLSCIKIWRQAAATSTRPYLSVVRRRHMCESPARAAEVHASGRFQSYAQGKDKGDEQHRNRGSHVSKHSKRMTDHSQPKCASWNNSREHNDVVHPRCWRPAARVHQYTKGKQADFTQGRGNRSCWVLHRTF